MKLDGSPARLGAHWESGCRCPCANFPPSSGYIALSLLRVARWRSARGMIELLCTRGRWNPKVTTIFGAAARYRRAIVFSSHDDAHPDNSELLTGAVRPHTGFWRSSSSYRPVGAMAVRKCPKFCQLFGVFRGRALSVRGVIDPHFSGFSSRLREVLRRILSLVNKTMRRHRAGFEPQHE
jgi:hypothetical protein